MATEGAASRVAGVHAAQDIGKRMQMEDRYVTAAREGHGQFAGVFDGHGGVRVAAYLAESMTAPVFDAIAAGKSAADAFADAFGRMEEECRHEDMGSTAVCAHIGGDLLTSANCGDAQCVVIGAAADTLSANHRLTDPAERARVLAAGAKIMDPYYFHGVKGMIPTRSFGDVTMRQVGLTARPHVSSRQLLPSDRYVLLASDGLFDVLKAEDIHALLAPSLSADAAAAVVLKSAMALGATDNVTVVVIALRV